MDQGFSGGSWEPGRGKKVTRYRWHTRSWWTSFGTAPSLGAELLVEALGVKLPPYTAARLTSADLTDIRPGEYRADVVVQLLNGDEPIWVLVVEVQLGVDARAREGRDVLPPSGRFIPADQSLRLASPHRAAASMAHEEADEKGRNEGDRCKDEDEE